MDDDDDDTHVLVPQTREASDFEYGCEWTRGQLTVTYSINDKALGAGEPIRVKRGAAGIDAPAERQRYRKPAHRFCRASSSKVIALDGNPVPVPQKG